MKRGRLLILMRKYFDNSSVHKANDARKNDQCLSVVYFKGTLPQHGVSHNEGIIDSMWRYFLAAFRGSIMSSLSIIKKYFAPIATVFASNVLIDFQEGNL